MQVGVKGKGDQRKLNTHPRLQGETKGKWYRYENVKSSFYFDLLPKHTVLCSTKRWCIKSPQNSYL